MIHSGPHTRACNGGCAICDDRQCGLHVEWHRQRIAQLESALRIVVEMASNGRSPGGWEMAAKYIRKIAREALKPAPLKHNTKE